MTEHTVCAWREAVCRLFLYSHSHLLHLYGRCTLHLCRYSSPAPPPSQRKHLVVPLGLHLHHTHKLYWAIMSPSVYLFPSNCVTVSPCLCLSYSFSPCLPLSRQSVSLPLLFCLSGLLSFPMLVLLHLVSISLSLIHHLTLILSVCPALVLRLSHTHFLAFTQCPPVSLSLTISLALRLRLLLYLR